MFSMILESFNSFIQKLRGNAYVNKAVLNSDFREMLMGVMKVGQLNYNGQ